MCKTAIWKQVMLKHLLVGIVNSLEAYQVLDLKSGGMFSCSTGTWRSVLSCSTATWRFLTFLHNFLGISSCNCFAHL